MIEIRLLEKKFGKNKILKGVDLAIDTPGIFAVLGPNGSGKTTIIKSILGMVIPDHGQININGELINKKWEYRKHIDYLPQIARFPENLKVRELIEMVKDIRQQPSQETVLIERFDLEPYMDSKLRNLSGGTRQKVNLVLCFMFDNQILILDEPTAGLDPVALIRLKELIKEEREKGKVILITTHIMDVVEELADEIVFLLEGKIYFKGSLSELAEITGEVHLEKSIANILESKKNQVNETVKTK